MIKNVFHGKINGEEFETVDAYNKRIDELLSSGESICAETSTKIVNVPDDDDQSGALSELKTDETIDSSQPIEVPPTESENNPSDIHNEVTNILNQLNGDKVNDEEILMSIIDEGEDFLEKLKNLLPDLDKDALIPFILELKGNVDEIARFQKTNSEALKQADERQVLAGTMSAIVDQMKHLEDYSQKLIGEFESLRNTFVEKLHDVCISDKIEGYITKAFEKYKKDWNDLCDEWNKATEEYNKLDDELDELRIRKVELSEIPESQNQKEVILRAANGVLNYLNKLYTEALKCVQHYIGNDEK